MKNKLYVLYAFYFVYFISYGIFLPYVNIYYESLGFTGGQIGQLGAISQLGAMLITPLWGIICDKSRRYKSMIGLSIILTIIATYFWQKQYVYITVLLLSVLMVSMRSCTMPISDSISVAYCNEQHKDYGKIRAIGSFGYIFGSSILSKVGTYFGLEAPFVFIYLISLGISLLILIPFPNVKMVAEHQKSNMLSDMKSLIKNKKYIFILVLAVFMNVTMDSVGGYVGNHLVSSLHLEQSAMGTYLIFAVVPEIFFVMMVSGLIRKYGYKKIYLITCICHVLRGVVYATTSSFTVFLLVSLVHMTMTGVACVGHIQYINRIVPQHFVTTAISVYISFTMIASSVLVQLFGTVYEFLGSRYIFWILAVMSLIALIMVATTKNFDFEGVEYEA